MINFPFYGELAHMFFHGCIPDKKVWYDTKTDSRKVTEEILEVCSKVPYLSTLTTYDFANKIDINLYLLTVDYCPLMDQSIELARKWNKGKKRNHKIF